MEVVEQMGKRYSKGRTQKWKIMKYTGSGMEWMCKSSNNHELKRFHGGVTETNRKKEQRDCMHYATSLNLPLHIWVTLEVVAVSSNTNP